MRPYQIAVCEDNGPERAELCGVCREILEQSGTEYEITEFSSAEELYERLKEYPDAWDLLFLDIRMGDMSGMELARRIRREGNPVKLVFVTGDEGFALEGYGVQPLHYLMKPVERKALEEAIRRALEERQEEEKLILRNGSRTIVLTPGEIRYAESYNHHILLHREDGQDSTCLLSLRELEKQLPPGRFCRCHNSYLINLEYVETVARTEISLRGGVHLPVGRAYYRIFQQTFIEYLNR